MVVLSVMKNTKYKKYQEATKQDSEFAELHASYMGIVQEVGPLMLDAVDEAVTNVCPITRLSLIAQIPPSWDPDRVIKALESLPIKPSKAIRDDVSGVIYLVK